MPSWKIHHRLLGGFALVIVLLIGLSAYSVRVTGGIDTALSANSQQNSVIQRAAIDFRGSVHDRAIALRDVVIAPDAAALQQELQHIERLAQAYARANTQLQAVLHSQANTVPPEVATLLAAIERDEVASRTTTANLLAQLQQGDQAGAQALLWAQIKPLYAQWLASINRLIDFEESRIRVNNAQANGAANEFGQAMLLITALAVALSVVAALLLARHITRALGAEPQEVRDVMRALQDGQLTVQVKVRPGDRSSVMAAVADMQQRLHELVSAVHSNIARLRTTGSEITDGNVRLGERTVHTSDNLHRTSDAMQALTVAVQHSAEHARQAEALAGDALGAASRGGTVMQQVVGTMQDIAASSHRIEEIIGVIDGIAFQTNILALNAAVEAARAGEQGRGFAVVAAEVRALAQRSAEAAHQIKALIASSVERVTAGNDLVEQAGSAMHDIVAHVQQVHQIIEAMGQATHTQSQDILQVNQAVSDLEGMTVQNATLVEASTATAGELEAQAANLAALAAAFTVHDHAAVLRLQSTAAR